MFVWPGIGKWLLIWPCSLILSLYLLKFIDFDLKIWLLYCQVGMAGKTGNGEEINYPSMDD